jgi:hypothetical protein
MAQPDPRPPRVRNAEETILDLHQEIERLLAALQRIKRLPANSSLDLAQSIADDALREYRFRL